MVKKGQRKQTQVTSPKPTTDLERSPYFVPVVFAVFFLLLVILFSEFLFSDKMLYGSDMIQAGIFFRSLLVDYVKTHGEVPQWNPYIFGGMPYVEAFHGDIFYPLSVLKFFGSIYRMLGMTLFFHIFLAGIFMYLAARQFRLSKTASLMSGACYMFAPYLISLVSPGHDGKIFVTTLFPLVMLFLDRGFEKRPWLNFSLLGLTIGVIILSPHPQMSYFTLWAVALYTVYKLYMLWREKKSFGVLVKPAVFSAYAVVIGLLLSAIQFYPGYIYTSEFSPRADTKRGWDWATSWSMHEEEAMSLLVPEFAGVSSQDASTLYWGKNPFKDNSESIGVVPVFLALLGLLFARRKDAYFFGGLALFALLYALGGTTPVFRLFYWLIPKVQSLRAPSMIMFLFSFSAALLAGMGIQYVLEARKKKETLGKHFRHLLFGFPGLMLFLALLFGLFGRSMLDLWSAIFYSEASTKMFQQGLTMIDVAYRNLPGIQAGVWIGFLFTALAALGIWLYRSGKMGMGVLVAVILIPAIDGVRFNQRFIDSFDQDRVWSPNALSRFFTEKEGHYRVVNFQAAAPDLLPYHGVPVVVGYHGNQLRWYDDLLGGPTLQNLTSPRLLNLTGARYVLLPAGQNLPEGYLGEKPLTKAADFGSLTVYRNDNALPRVFLADLYKVSEDRNAIVDQVLNGDGNMREIVYLEQQPPLTITPDTTAMDSAWIEYYDLDSITIGVNCSQNKLLVLTDNYFDAWHATVDTHPAELMRAYGSFRAVAVPAGAREVTFVYESTRYRTGKLVTWLTSLYLLGVFGVYLVRSRNRRKKKESADR